ncbi:energy transducer TonB [Spirosoma sordidisoli]|uniref:Energy transducer TonB n=1 Tax=Spirosoma sordidisoli TaxID=2502893 RepID=A0A4Q2UUZ2_9BACT|nr:energy transducer TonB [Spirosoma sordidisoli]RYC71640.1 energy transducer TonB [Spirosoma sordidisoli]
MSRIATPADALTYNEIIFQARHRAYGAFDLRQQYRPALTRALWVGVGLFLLGLAAPTLYARLFPKPDLSDQIVLVETDLVKLPDTPNEQPVPIPPVEQAPAVSTVRNLPPVVLPDPEVVDEALPPTTEQLEKATSGPVTAEGTGVDEVIAAPEATGPTATERALDVAPTNHDETFIAVEQQPEYPGGMAALSDFVTRTLQYPRRASTAGISGRVYVSFIVNTDGSLTEVQVLKGIGFGCDEEAVRVVQKMPRWRPGKQSGRSVRVKFTLPIAFTLE